MINYDTSSGVKVTHEKEMVQFLTIKKRTNGSISDTLKENNSVFVHVVCQVGVSPLASRSMRSSLTIPGEDR